MRIETNPERARCAPTSSAAVALAWAACLLVLASGAATAQTPGPGTPARGGTGPGTPSQSQAPSQSQDTGITFGTWVQQGGEMMQQGVTTMGAGFGQMVGAIGGQTKDAADAARNAAESVTKLPTSGITEGHERCAIAANGAPDCQGAAARLCRTKGFAGGTSVDFVTVENCPPQYRTSRRHLPEGVCPMEHFVTRALCQ
ncbi:MAG: hypothetical protein J2P53_11950 [Bradyrhizobiaceae bacterium]|nr:hypothetical protein [Bradyrhizobiaceae bacterium]